MPTEKLQLPTISGNQTNDVETHFNALANAVDNKAGAANGLATLGADGKVPGSQLNVDLSPIQQEIAAHQADDTSHVRYGSAAGTNAKTITLNPAPTELVEGFALSFKSVAANTGASTLNVNGLGAKPIVKSNGNAVASGNLKTGSIYTVRYDGTSFILQGEGGEYGTATAGHVLAPNTIGTDAGIVTGTMPNRGAFNLPFGSSVPAGYYSGGNVPSGKRSIGGTVTGVSANQSRQVTGLPFNPSYVHVWYEWGTYNGECTGAISKRVGYPLAKYESNIDMSNISGNTFTFYFRVNVSGVTVNWLAIE